MKSFVFVSDLHGRPLHLQPADVLIFAGDATNDGSEEEFRKFNEWLGQQPQELKLYMPGNHDVLAQTDPALVREILTNAKMMIDKPATVHGAKFYFSPWTRSRGGDKKWAFPLVEGTTQAADKWKLIPEGLDVLVTHGPAYGVSDLHHRQKYTHLGDGQLKQRLVAMKAPPRFHVFGHIHEGVRFTEKFGIKFYNVSICDVNNVATKAPVVLEYDGTNWTAR